MFCVLILCARSCKIDLFETLQLRGTRRAVSAAVSGNYNIDSSMVYWNKERI